LAVVFSFLLPIDANVVTDSFNLSFPANDFYWSGILLFMTIVWGLGTWFYESRMFSLAAFTAFILSILRFDNALSLFNDWIAFTIGFANLVGLIVIRLLQNWKDKNFAQPILITAQASQVIVLIASLTGIVINLLESDVASNVWIAHMLTWLFAASFFAASNFLVPFILFPWMAVTSLFLIPWLFLSTFDASSSVQIAGLVVWGSLAALASEFTHRAQNKHLKQYSTPMLTLSLPLFAVGVLWGLVINTQYAFASLLGIGAVYTVVNIMRARWHVWSAALLSWLGAYFIFFTLPFMQKADVYFGYQLLIVSVLLLVPELFMKGSLTLKRSWNWPPVALGIFIVSLNILLAHVALLDSDTYFGRAAITLGVYAVLFAAYAWRFKQPLIGYLSTTSLALTVIYSLSHFDLDLWLPSLTALSTIYYLAGYFIQRNEQNKTWGAMLVNSGLALGTILSTIALFTLKSTGGWYALLIAVLFITEMFTRRNGYLEIFAISLFSAAFILILNDFKIKDLAYYPFGLSLIWLAGDAILQRTFDGRKTEPVTRLVGGLAALTFTLLATINDGLASSAVSACFAVYTVFFAAYAWVYKSPRLGYLSTASAAVTMFYALDYFKIEAWLPIFTGLSLAYYLAGYFIHKKSADWAEMFRYSGLVLGSIVSLVALIGLEPTGGWYALIIGMLFVIETVSRRNGWFEAGIHVLFSVAAFLILHDFNINQTSYILLTLSLVWLGGDVILHQTFAERKIAMHTRVIGAGMAAVNALTVISGSAAEAAICFGVYTVFFAVYALLYNQPMIGYVSTVSMPLTVFFSLRAAEQQRWLFPIIAVAVLFYAIGFFLRHTNREKWAEVL
ncbi:MAG TPA: hypothetical protein VJ972_02955, partial [Anaerolineales bacterium]|nr:hypothetical protein [Anaerolineales bacterium]